MPHSFRTHLRMCMSQHTHDMPVTELRELFLRRYQAFLILRGVSPHLLCCRQAAMEVLGASESVVEAKSLPEGNHPPDWTSHP